MSLLEDGRGMLAKQSMTQAIDNAESASGIMGSKGVLSVWARCTGFLPSLMLFDSMKLTS